MTYMWLAVMIITAITEALTSAVVSIWFTFGALIALISSILKVSAIWQFFIFILASVIALIISKPLVKNKLLTEKVPTNADSVIGKTAYVNEKINIFDSTGQVKVNGAIWSAKSEDGEIIDEGTAVTVSEIKGVHLIVKKKEEL